MKLVTAVFAVCLALTVSAFGQMTPVGPKNKPVDKTVYKEVKVNAISLPEGYSAGQVSGNIKDGTKLQSLRWAANSSVACFPMTRASYFTGNHVFYRIAMPAASSMKITLIPKNGAKLSLYTLRQSTDPARQQVPPNVSRAISCESSYPIVANLTSGRQVRKARKEIKTEFISVRSPYSMLIGIAGQNGATAGDFDLKVEVKSR